MKIISWNVNGIRAAYKKGFANFIKQYQPDILCVQETKAWEEQLTPEELSPHGYQSVFSNAEKKGYSGVAVFHKPKLKVKVIASGINNPEYDSEGRFLIIQVNGIYLYNIYFPSGTTGDLRQAYKYKFLDAVYGYLNSQSPQKRNKTIICGDFNICHKEIDIHHPKQATKLELSGFLPEERLWMDKFSNSGFIDSFRHINGNIKDKYSWWSYRAGARQKNLGWRIDYFFTAYKLQDQIKDAGILSDITGSDHAPIFLELK